MKKVLKLLTVFILTALLSVTLWASEKKKVAVLPFSVHSAENIEYIRQGIWSILSSRIASSGKIDVVSRDIIGEAIKSKGPNEMSPSDINDLGMRLNVNHVVYGTITKIGNSLSIDGNILDVSGQKPTVNIFTQTQGMDDVIPKISEFAQRIDQQIQGITTASPAVAETPAQILPQPQRLPQLGRESEIISGIRTSKKGTLTAVINPDFINTTEHIDRRGFWMSQNFSTEFKGMDIGDVNGDGLNEVVIIDTNSVMIYQMKGREFKFIEKIQGKSHDNYLSVDIADINQNGIKEIIITNLSASSPNSFVIEYRNGKFETIASNIRYFLRVINPPSGPILIGQPRGLDEVFNTPIHEIIWENGRYVQGKRMKIPDGLSVYGLTIDSITRAGSEKIITLDEDDYLNIYELTDKPLSKIRVFGGSKERVWKSDEPFGGSNNYIDTSTTTGAERSDKKTFINLRIITYDAKGDGKKEIILVKNLSASGRLLQNIKAFTAAEIYSFEWDGLGLLENWRTRKINGYVADYQFKDIDNDGQNEVVIALVLSTGLSLSNKSVLVYYKINPQQGG